MALRWEVKNLKPVVRNTLRCTFDLFAKPLLIKNLTYHKHANGREWVGFPGQPRLDLEGNTLRDERGKHRYVNMVLIPDQEVREKFQEWCCEAVRVELDRFGDDIKRQEEFVKSDDSDFE